METHCRQELNGGSLPLFQKFFLLYRVLELQDREVQFDGCLCIARLQVVVKDSGDQLAASSKTCLALMSLNISSLICI